MTKFKRYIRNIFSIAGLEWNDGKNVKSQSDAIVITESNISSAAYRSQIRDRQYILTIKNFAENVVHPLVAALIVPQGLAGTIQFSDGVFLDGDNNNFFWDNTNKRLGIGTNTPGVMLDTNGIIRSSTTIQASGDKVVLSDNAGDGNFQLKDNAGVVKSFITSNGDSYFLGGNIGIGVSSPTVALDILGDIITSGNNTTLGSMTVSGDIDSLGAINATDDLTSTADVISGGGLVILSDTVGDGSGDGVIDINDSGSNNTIRFNSNGDSYINGGKVGIGVNTPISVLDIYSPGGSTQGFNLVAGSESATEFPIFKVNNLQETNPVVITSKGKVGIGTDTPRASLHSSKSVLGEHIALLLENNAGDGTEITSVSIDFNHNGTYINSTENHATAKIKIEEYDLNDYRTSMAFYVQSVDASNAPLLEAMKIISTGNVGIGTATPGSKLSVVGLPTSSAGLSAGDIWNNAGVLNIV